MPVINIYLWSLICVLLQTVVVQSAGLSSLLSYDGFQRICLCRCGVSKTGSKMDLAMDDPPVLPHEFPWLVALNIGSRVLGGSLISDKHILTAASPFYGVTPDRVVVTIGAHDRCVEGDSALNVTVESITILPGFSNITLENDLALLTLKHVMAFSEYISPICLPVFGTKDNEQVTWTAGWSQNNGNCTPQVAVLPLLPTATCNQAKNSDFTMTNDKGCLGPLGVQNVICKNDVGSPVMGRWLATSPLRLIGVISASSCDVTTPPLYTKVYNHVDWIYEHIRKDCVCL